jgi:hypothetical protein
MADTFNLTASFDKTSYAPGDAMTLTVAGTVTSGSPVPISATITVQAADGSTATLAASSQVAGAPETWAITAVTDTASRTWTVSPDGKSATATA